MALLALLSKGDIRERRAGFLGGDGMVAGPCVVLFLSGEIISICFTLVRGRDSVPEGTEVRRWSQGVVQDEGATSTRPHGHLLSP